VAGAARTHHYNVSNVFHGLGLSLDCELPI
jgi:hypothetical protein